jgi:hypothetical protein
MPYLYVCEILTIIHTHIFESMYPARLHPPLWLCFTRQLCPHCWWLLAVALHSSTLTSALAYDSSVHICSYPVLGTLLLAVHLLWYTDCQPSMAVKFPRTSERLRIPRVSEACQGSQETLPTPPECLQIVWTVFTTDFSKVFVLPVL